MTDLFSDIARLIFPASSSRLEAASCGFALANIYRDATDPGVVWESLVFGSDAHTICDIILKIRQEDPDAAIRINELVAEHISPRIAHRCGEMIEIVDLYVTYISQPFSKIQPSKVVGSEIKLAVDRYLEPCGYNDAVCDKGCIITGDAIPRRHEIWPPCECGGRLRARAIYRGIIDSLEIHEDDLGPLAVVNDLKSQGNILKRDDLFEHFQLIGYAWLVWLHYPHIRRFRIQIYYLRYGFAQWVEFTIPEHRGQLDEHGVALPDLFSTWETRYHIRVQRVLSYTDEDLEKPQPGDYCNLCDFHHICPLMQRVMKNLGGSPFVESPSGALRAAEEFFAIRAMQKDYKQKLEAYVARHGPIDFGDERPVLTYRASTGSDWDARELFDLLTGAMGWMPDQLFEEAILKVDKVKLKKAMKAMSTEEYAQILAIASQTESQAFTFVKKPKVSGKLP